MHSQPFSASPNVLKREKRLFGRGTITVQNDLDEFVRISVNDGFFYLFITKSHLIRHNVVCVAYFTRWKTSRKSDHIVSNHGVNGQEWFRGTGFYGRSLTTIRPKSSRKVHYNQIEGDMAHCTVLSMENDVLILDETVVNGESYKLQRYGEMIFLDTQVITVTQPMPKRREVCPPSYCDQDIMYAHCSPNLKCEAETQMPSSWFGIDAVRYSTITIIPLLITTDNYYHPSNANLSCLPCCKTRSNHPKIPSKIYTYFISYHN